MSIQWKARILFSIPFILMSYFFLPKPWWFLPRLLAGHNRAMYGTYRGTLVADDGGDMQAPDARVQVRLTLRPPRRSTLGTPTATPGETSRTIA